MLIWSRVEKRIGVDLVHNAEEVDGLGAAHDAVRGEHHRGLGVLDFADLPLRK